MPLSTWLGHCDTPGHVPGYGPLDATDSRALADALAAKVGTTWCLTLTDTHGSPVAHGCARASPTAGKRRAPPAARSPDGCPAPAPASWTFTISLLEQGQCSHARQTTGYRPSPALRHVIEIRQATCTFPGCMRPATRCDQDHTVPYHLGGRTCECNLNPRLLVRRSRRCHPLVTVLVAGS